MPRVAGWLGATKGPGWRGTHQPSDIRSDIISRMVAPAQMLRQARRRAGLSQRELAERAGVPQSAVARLESGRVVPRVDTLERLLRACGSTLEVVPIPEVDRTAIRELLRLTPGERLRLAAAEAASLERLLTT